MTNQLCKLALRIDAGPDVESDELEKLTLRLQRELKHLEGVEAVQRIKGDAVPGGAKAAATVTLDGLAVEFLGENVAEMVEFLSDWSELQKPETKIDLMVGEQPVAIDSAMSQKMLQGVINLIKNTLE